MKPCEVKRYREIQKLKRGAVDCGDSWILFNRTNEIVITNQKVGESPTGSVVLTRRQMQKFCDWWMGVKP
jgi:hypothetical protein